MSAFAQTFLLRDPVLRVWSLHTYCQRPGYTKSHPLQAKAQQLALAQFAAQEPSAQNVMCKVLLGRWAQDPREVTEADFHRAQAQLACFDVVEPLERLGSFLGRLHPFVQARAGVPLSAFRELRINASTKTKHRNQLPSTTIARLEALNRWDLQLWSQAL